MDILADLSLPQIFLGLLGTFLLVLSLFGTSLRQHWHLPHSLSRLFKHKPFFRILRCHRSLSFYFSNFMSGGENRIRRVASTLPISRIMQ